MVAEQVGIVEDNDVKDDLAELCRFWSSTSGEKLTSLDEYVASMYALSLSVWSMVWRRWLSAVGGSAPCAPLPHRVCSRSQEG